MYLSHAIAALALGVVMAGGNRSANAGETKTAPADPSIPEHVELPADGADLAALLRAKSAIQARIDALQKRHLDEIREYGEDPQAILELKVENVAKLVLRGREMADASQRSVAARDQADDKPPTNADLAAVDPAMAVLREQQKLLKAHAEAIEQREGKDSPAAQAARQELSRLTQRIEDYANDLRAKFFILTAANGKKVLVFKNLTILKSNLEHFYAIEAKEIERLNELATHAAIVRQIRADLAADKEEATIVNTRIEAVRAKTGL